jgi:hypothetical protein
VIRSAISKFEIEFLVTVICTEEFLNQPNGECVFHIFRLFEEHLKAGDYPEFVEFCQVFHDKSRMIIKDEIRRTLFSEMPKPATIAKLLHKCE